MGISLENFERGKKVDETTRKQVCRDWTGKNKKQKGGRKNWKPTEDEIKELIYKRKLEGSCFCCIFWNWHFGSKSGDIHTCPIRKIKVAGYMRCKGYHRTRL